MSRKIKTIDPSALFPYLWGLGWFVARWIAGAILDRIGAKIKTRHVIGGIALATGAPGFGIGAWALWIIFRYELPVALGLVRQYPQGVAIYIGSQLLVWTVAAIVGVLLVGLAIVAFFPESPRAQWIGRHLPLLRRIQFPRKWPSSGKPFKYAWTGLKEPKPAASAL